MLMALSCLILNTDERGPPVACLLTVPKPQLASNCRRVIAVVFQILKLIIYIIKKKNKGAKLLFVQVDQLGKEEVLTRILKRQ